jgi:hypothetical protein
LGKHTLLRGGRRPLSAVRANAAEMPRRPRVNHPVISPILANVYLHYVFDLWAHRWRLTKHDRRVAGSQQLIRPAAATDGTRLRACDAPAFRGACRLFRGGGQGPQYSEFAAEPVGSVKHVVPGESPVRMIQRRSAAGTPFTGEGPGGWSGNPVVAGRAGRWPPPIPQQRRRGRWPCAPRARSRSMRRPRAEK